MIGAAPGSPDAAPKPPSRLAFLVGALLGPLLLVLVATWFSNETHHLVHDRTEARLSYERRVAMADTMTSLAEAESAQRGYVLTGGRGLLEAYRRSRAELLPHLNDLSRVYADEPAQRALFAQLVPVIGEKFAEMDAVIALRDSKGMAAAADRVSSYEGVRLMAKAASLVDAMISEEQRQVTDSIATVTVRNTRMQHFVWTLEVVGGLLWLIGLAAAWYARGERYRIERAAHETATQLRAIFAGTYDGIVIVDSEGRIRAANAGTTRLTGYREDELVGLEALSLIDVIPGPQTFAERIGLGEGGVSHPVWVDRLVRHRDGHKVPVDIALSPMRMGSEIEVITAIRDISERKATERMKDDFIATVSHELRTPLTSVVGSLGLLRAGSVGQLPDAAYRLVEIAENNSRRLIRLINDILDIEKIGSGRMQFESARIDVAPLARRAIEGVLGMAESRRVRFDLDATEERLVVNGDAERLLQVLTNLLSNAIRFSPDDGRIHVGVTREDGHAVLTVDDEGPGIPPEFKGRMFERFSQASASKAHGGTGLGLAISREIVAAHDGRIWFDDAPTGGARLAFNLPLVPPEIVESPGDRHTRILVCEPHVETADAFRALLEAEGYVVDCVGTAREAERAARSGRYDGVVIDLVLPDSTGLDSVRVLRRRAETREIPVIVVSAEAGIGGSDPAAAALDVIDWIDKPVDQERLISAVKVAVSHSDATRPTLLHIDDDVELLEVVATALADQGRMMRATTVAGGRQMLAEHTPDIVILDVGLPDGSGLDLLPDLFGADGNAIPTIIYSAIDVLPEVQGRVDAVLVKSRRSLSSLARTIRRVLAANAVPPEAP